MVDLVSGLPRLWAIFLLAMFPIIELRGAIPLAIAWNLPPLSSFWVAALGNIIPIFPLLYFLEPVSLWLGRQFNFFKNFFEWVFARGRRHKGKIERYGYWGLALFVAIPIPGTGVWVGSVIAFLLGLSAIPSFLAMTLGVVVAGFIMMALSLGVVQLITGQGLLWTIVVLLLFSSIIIFRKNKNK
ncbi:MAG: small multi-drug export protein [Bacillota bacterium]